MFVYNVCTPCLRCRDVYTMRVRDGWTDGWMDVVFLQGRHFFWPPTPYSFLRIMSQPPHAMANPVMPQPSGAQPNQPAGPNCNGGLRPCHCPMSTHLYAVAQTSRKMEWSRCATLLRPGQEMSCQRRARKALVGSANISTRNNRHDAVNLVPVQCPQVQNLHLPTGRCVPQCPSQTRPDSIIVDVSPDTPCLDASAVLLVLLDCREGPWASSTVLSSKF